MLVTIFGIVIQLICRFLHLVRCMPIIHRDSREMLGLGFVAYMALITSMSFTDTIFVAYSVAAWYLIVLTQESRVVARKPRDATAISLSV